MMDIKSLTKTKMFGLNIPRSLAWKLLNKILYKIDAHIIFFSEKHRRKIINVIHKIIKENKGDSIQENTIYIHEGYNIISCLNSVIDLPGDIIELGVFKGKSAKLICEFKKNKHLHLFDTFKGLPEVSKIDNLNFERNEEKYYKGQYACSLKFVKNYLKKYKNVYFYKGLFPKTGNPIKNKKFCFVNIDFDIYQSTHNALEFIYPKVVKGGIIICHDYVQAYGVRKAMNEFFKNKPENIIELVGLHGIVVKL